MSFILKPGKNSAWRNRELKNLLTAFILHGKIETSLPLARNNKKKNLTKSSAKFVSLAKKANKEPKKKQHFYRLALCLVNKTIDKKGISKVFDNVGKKYCDRPGGFTRVIKLGSRQGDNSPRAIV